ncbi:hypothetical protein MROS_1856 [Melioribacter roseus P3M-2]|uniref:Uncharacterized protein n=1 Tax=Melioribacter roseus (strain DSM 23840 / JCM 17771 / VKM B-2668 / P3M-2) TaxID=1191523 RepID=I6ZSS4_MELRP|nr:hypothetical protein [Melioribacter roseus]AFN75089.1 hypothetical protein MROS_1856 [Melioribacter roseus P3M-2]
MMNERLIENIKKFLPVLPIILLTIVLMLVFKFNKENIDVFIEERQNDIISFYAGSLKPLFYKTQISNEDIFNFALYKYLPIDKVNNEVVLISDDTAKRDVVYEIKTLPAEADQNHYKQFVDYLQLNAAQRRQVDSLLEFYKKQIYYSILTGDNQTLAFNSRLADLQKTLLADLINFARRINKSKIDILLAKNRNIPHEWEFIDFVKTTRKVRDDRFLFITPDTVFFAKGNIDTQALDNQFMHTGTKGIPAAGNIKFELLKDHSVFNIKFDSSNFKVSIPYSDDYYEGTKEFRVKLDNLNKELQRIQIDLPKLLEAEISVEKKFKYDQHNIDPSEIIKATLKAVGEKGEVDWEEFGRKIDSMARSYADSVSKQKKVNP